MIGSSIYRNGGDWIGKPVSDGLLGNRFDSSSLTFGGNGLSDTPANPGASGRDAEDLMALIKLAATKISPADAFGRSNANSVTTCWSYSDLLTNNIFRMEVTESILKEIAGELDTGFNVYFNVKTLEIVTLPDEDMMDPDILKEWKDDYKRVKKDKSFVHIEKMDSKESYRMMAGFIDTLPEGRIADRLLQAIGGHKPFANFKLQVDQSGSNREEWFKFKDQQVMEHVKEQLEVIKPT